MMLTKPQNLKARFLRSKDGDLRQADLLKKILNDYSPTVIVNLAGQSSVDVVEKAAEEYWPVNVLLVKRLADWCDEHTAHLVQVSSQGIFDGDDPPYSAKDRPCAVNQYGIQKIEAEDYVRRHQRWTIARLTFVVGVRPFRGVGRRNPAEDMLSLQHTMQVNDRFFSPCFAQDAAIHLWALAVSQPLRKVFHIGTPVRVSRYDIARALTPDADIEPVPHDTFVGMAPRPHDTTWAEGDWTMWSKSFSEGTEQVLEDWKNADRKDLWSRAQEIGIFFGIDTTLVAERLREGFVPLHHAVAEDFNLSGPVGDDELLSWYRKTEAYIWELSAYHLDEGFNYMGMCEGITNHCVALNLDRVLCLGDGIGDLTMTLARAGRTPIYHDLANSRTAEFALFRFEHLLDKMPQYYLTAGWSPGNFPPGLDAVIALDFFEHLTNVEEWAQATANLLRPGGWFLAQNAFAIGDDEHGGSIPMHLVKNNRFETDWDPLLRSLGMNQVEGGWWRKNE